MFLGHKNQALGAQAWSNPSTAAYMHTDSGVLPIRGANITDVARLTFAEHPVRILPALTVRAPLLTLNTTARLLDGVPTLEAGVAVEFNISVTAEGNGVTRDAHNIAVSIPTLYLGTAQLISASVDGQSVSAAVSTNARQETGRYVYPLGTLRPGETLVIVCRFIAKETTPHGPGQIDFGITTTFDTLPTPVDADQFITVYDAEASPAITAFALTAVMCRLRVAPLAPGTPAYSTVGVAAPVAKPLLLELNVVFPRGTSKQATVAISLPVAGMAFAGEPSASNITECDLWAASAGALATDALLPLVQGSTGKFCRDNNTGIVATGVTAVIRNTDAKAQLVLTYASVRSFPVQGANASLDGSNRLRLVVPVVVISSAAAFAEYAVTATFARPNGTAVDSTVAVSVIEPSLAQDLAVDVAPSVQAGDVVRFTHTIQHDAASTSMAYALVSTVPLPDILEVNNVETSCTATGSQPNKNDDNNALRCTAAVVPPGCTAGCQLATTVTSPTSTNGSANATRFTSGQAISTCNISLPV